MRENRVLVADSHEIVRIGIESVFETQGDYKVCAQASDGRAAVRMARCSRPEVVLLDANLPKLNGLDAARQILADNPGQRILVFTEIDSYCTMREALEIGVRGYVLKSDPVRDLVTAVDALLHERTFFTWRMTEIVFAIAKSQRREPLLSDREREIVQLIVEGNCSAQVAEILSLSPNTVETHRTNVRRKLKVNSTAELILYAVRNDIVCIPELSSRTSMLSKSRHACYRAPDREPAFEAITPSDCVLRRSPITASGSLT
jgi:DNA-binding NarL/FixJ family response regulator